MKTPIFAFCFFAAIFADAQEKLEHPTRFIDGKSYNVSSLWSWSQTERTRRGGNKTPTPPKPMPGWVIYPHSADRFYTSAYVSQILPDGILVETRTSNLQDFSRPEMWGGSYLLKNFPATNLVDGQQIEFIAKEAGMYQFKNPFTPVRTIKAYDYGLLPVKAVVVAKKETEPERLARETKKKEATARAVELDRSQAEKGDSFAQCRLGERYLKGDGLAVDPQKAREWFAKSAGQGNKLAISALKKLDTETASK